MHFDVIFPILAEQLQWSGPITLMKIKSHAGGLMNECAEKAEEGRTAESVRIMRSCDPALRNMALSL